MIRQLTVDDRATFRDIREEAMRTYPESFGSLDKEQYKTEDDIAAYQDCLKHEVWGDFENGRLVGIAGFYISPTKTAQSCGEIFSLYVRGGHRDKGIADQLIKRILTLAENCVDQVHVCAVHTAKAAIKLFLNNGFEIVHTDAEAFSLGDVNYQEHLLVKKLR